MTLTLPSKVALQQETTRRASLNELLDTPERSRGEVLQQQNPDGCSTRLVAGGVILPFIAVLQAFLSIAVTDGVGRTLWLGSCAAAVVAAAWMVRKGTQMMRRNDEGYRLVQEANQRARREALLDAQKHHHLTRLEKAPLHLAPGQASVWGAERDGRTVQVELSFPTWESALEARTLHGAESPPHKE